MAVNPILQMYWGREAQDVAVEFSVVLGRSHMRIQQLMKIVHGAVIDFGVTTENNASVYANNKQLVCGEVMITGENFGVSVTENVTSSED